MCAQLAQGAMALLGDHHPPHAGFGHAGARPAAEPSPTAKLKRRTTVGHWLHTKHASKDLNLMELLDLPGHESAQLVTTLARVVQATQEAVRPFAFSIMPTDRGVRIEGDPAAVMIATRILEQTSHHAAGWRAEAGILEGLIPGIIAQMLKCDFSLVLNGLPKYLTLQSVSQAAYLQALLDPHGQLVIGLGPTGTGKTHLAIVAALNQLAEDRVQRIVLTRPHVVEEGEIVTAATRQERGFDSQLDFFDDILLELLGHDRVARMKSDLVLEIIPLGRMRGRTFNNAFVIMDEAQNATISKMRTVVTRIGTGTRMVLTGDPSHVDLLGGEPSGLIDLLDLIKGTDIATIHRFEKLDIVRNDIVARLDQLYASRQSEFRHGA